MQKRRNFIIGKDRNCVLLLKLNYDFHTIKLQTLDECSIYEYNFYYLNGIVLNKIAYLCGL